MTMPRMRWDRAVRMLGVAVGVSLLAGCGTDPAPAAEASVLEGSESVATSDLQQEEGWAFSYSGDFSGEVSGTVIAVTGMALSMQMVTVAARSHDTDAGFTATWQFPQDEDPSGEKRVLSFSLTLEDGMDCSPDLRAEQRVMANVLEPDTDLLHAEFSGILTCDVDRLIEIDGFVRRE